MKCPVCDKAMVEMDFHELATMYACPHGHTYGVIGPDGEYTELVPKPTLVNTATLQDVHAEAVADYKLIVATREYEDPLEGYLLVGRDNIYVRLRFSLDDACTDLSNEQKHLLNLIVEKLNK